MSLSNLIEVRVVPKTRDHPLEEKGGPNAFQVINIDRLTFGGPLRVPLDSVIRFNIQQEGDAHPLYIDVVPGGGPESERELDSRKVAPHGSTRGVTNGILGWKPEREGTYYAECADHRWMGWPIVVARWENEPVALHCAWCEHAILEDLRQEKTDPVKVFCSEWCQGEWYLEVGARRGKGHSRTQLSKRQRAKVSRVMREFSKGKLKTSGGQKVTDRRQALAIAYSKARRMK